MKKMKASQLKRESEEERAKESMKEDEGKINDIQRKVSIRKEILEVRIKERGSMMIGSLTNEGQCPSNTLGRLVEQK